MPIRKKIIHFHLKRLKSLDAIAPKPFKCPKQKMDRLAPEKLVSKNQAIKAIEL
jgi:hypothetical protein